MRTPIIRGFALDDKVWVGKHGPARIIGFFIEPTAIIEYDNGDQHTVTVTSLSFEKEES